MTTLVERSVGVFCRTPGCAGWAQVGRRCLRSHDEAVARASEIVDRFGIAEALDANPDVLDRMIDDILAFPGGTPNDRLNEELQRPQPVSEDEHNKKVLNARMAEAEEQDQERFEGIA